MRRGEAAGLLRDALALDALVITSLGTAGRAWRESDPPQLSYPASDPMGTSPSLALGLALAQPERPVLLIAGDGEWAMNLGVLLTIAGAAPANLRLVVWRNGRYETGGGASLPGGDGVDFASLAAGAGIGWTGEARTLDEAARLVPQQLAAQGPALLVLHVEPEASPYRPEGPYAQVEQRALFMERLLGHG
jgi:thiamine pyrophosphate-dependent acetolactate synthase large subunit-like protein